MKQLSPGFIPGTLSGCLLKFPLLGFLDSFPSDFLCLNLPIFFFFLFGSLGGVGSGVGNNSGFASLNLFRANFCLLLTIFSPNDEQPETESRSD